MDPVAHDSYVLLHLAPIVVSSAPLFELVSPLLHLLIDPFAVVFAVVLVDFVVPVVMLDLTYQTVVYIPAPLAVLTLLQRDRIYAPAALHTAED